MKDGHNKKEKMNCHRGFFVGDSVSVTRKYDKKYKAKGFVISIRSNKKGNFLYAIAPDFKNKNMVDAMSSLWYQIENVTWTYTNRLKSRRALLTEKLTT